MISHAFWIRRFAAAADAVGSSLRINGRPYTIVGVTEEGFQGNTFIGTDLWVPFAMAPHLTGRASMSNGKPGAYVGTCQPRSTAGRHPSGVVAEGGSRQSGRPRSSSNRRVSRRDHISAWLR